MPSDTRAPKEPSLQTVFPSHFVPFDDSAHNFLVVVLVDLFVLGPCSPQLQEAVHTLEHLGLTWQDDVAAGSF